MTGLIPFAQRFIAGTSTRTVSARNLHEFLGSKRQFSDWIKDRIAKYGFEENTDYLYVSQNCETLSGRPKNTYFLTTDMAKELCMVERSDKGRIARRYFIACEKELNTLKAEKQLPAPSPNDRDKYKLINAMIRQMELNGDPVVIPIPTCSAWFSNCAAASTT